MWQWLTTSSVNPAATALTVRAAMLAGVPAVIWILRILGVDAVLGADLEPTIEALSRMIEGALWIISGFGVVYGFGRKVYLTIKNKLQELQHK